MATNLHNLCRGEHTTTTPRVPWTAPGLRWGHYSQLLTFGVGCRCSTTWRHIWQHWEGGAAAGWLAPSLRNKGMRVSYGAKASSKQYAPQSMGTPTQAFEPMPEMSPQFPQDKQVLDAAFRSPADQSPLGHNQRSLGHLDFQEIITLCWESRDKRVCSLVAGMHESSSSLMPLKQSQKSFYPK